MGKKSRKRKIKWRKSSERMLCNIHKWFWLKIFYRNWRWNRDDISNKISSGFRSYWKKNSRLIFKTFDKSKYGNIQRENKDTSANLKTEGKGIIELKNTRDELIRLENIIYARDLSKNLISLRKFADEGLGIYLVSERINIYSIYILLYIYFYIFLFRVKKIVYLRNLWKTILDNWICGGKWKT